MSLMGLGATLGASNFAMLGCEGAGVNGEDGARGCVCSGCWFCGGAVAIPPIGPERAGCLAGVICERAAWYT
jgi:hypothetical protein